MMKRQTILKNALIISIIFILNIPHFMLLKVEQINNTTMYRTTSTDFGDRPYADSLQRRMSCGRQSKALERSIRIAATY
jgi:hypothetical protein